MVSTSWKGVRRFYAHVDVKQAENVVDVYGRALTGWQVLIEGRPLRTHAVNELVVPTEGLARAIAGEFASQGDMIRPATMPLYNLACLAVDNFVNEDLAAAEELEALHRATRLSTFDVMEARAQVQAEREGVREDGKGSVKSTTLSEMLAGNGDSSAVPAHARTALTGRSESGALSSSGSSGTAKLRDLLLDYLETDSICYRVDWDMADPSERLLRKRQDSLYAPLMDWFQGAYGVRLDVAVGITDVNHPEEAYMAVEDAADTADPWLKAVLQSAVGVLKSSVLALALVHRAVDVQGAIEAARVEEEWQIGENGFVEDGHDTTAAYMRAHISAASTFLWLLPASNPAPLPAQGKKGYAEQLARTQQERAARVMVRREREARLVGQKRAIMKQMALEEARGGGGAVGASAGKPQLA